MESEERKEVKNDCQRCCYYKSYYIKEMYQFSKQDIGFCRVQERIVGKRETCEDFRWRYYGRQTATLQAQLEKTIEIFTQLKQIEEEDIEKRREWEIRESAASQMRHEERKRLMKERKKKSP